MKLIRNKKGQFDKGTIPWTTGKKVFIGKDNPFYGKKHSDISKIKIKEKRKLQDMSWRKDWHPSEESKLKNRLKHIGKRLGYENNMWKGGKMKEYPIFFQIRLSFKYRQWRSDIFTRDKFICQECFKIGGNLHAHHIKPFYKIIDEYKIKSLEDADNCEELWNINNGITLCENCHHKTFHLCK